MDERPLPTLANTDGDPLLLTTDKYRILGRRRETVESRLGSIDGVEVDENERGVTRYTFTRPGNKQHKSWENTIIGHAKISGESLNVETNSVRRADDLKKRVLEVCGELIEHRGRVRRSQGAHAENTRW
jgi:hypothetical protein